MIVGFGFGSPLVSLLMLAATSLLSYGLYKLATRSRRIRNPEGRKQQLRRYYREQRELARRLSREFDLTDEEIEQKVKEEVDR